MRLVFALFIIVSIEAKKKRPKPPLDIQNDIPRSRSNVDVYPQHFRQPVPFGHIFKEGFADPKSDLKPPIDFLELDMVKPKDANEAREIWNKGKYPIQIIPKNLPRIFASPRDKHVYEQQLEREAGTPKPNTDAVKNERRPWIDWEAVQHLNIGKRRPLFRLPQSRNNSVQEVGHDSGPKRKYFAPESFDLVSNTKKDLINWTTCDEFGKSPNFHPKDIVNIDWVPFYVWATKENHEAVVHRFSYPTKKLVKQYKEDYSAHLNQSIDWEQPKLVLKEVLETLLIAGDRAGLFYGVPHLSIPSYMKNKQILFPTLTIRLKVEDPYLAIMYCEHKFTAIMAVSGNEPPTGKDKVAEAAVLKFRGLGYPVYRELERERQRAQAESEWLAKRKENEVITIDRPVVRDHFFGKNFQ